MTVTVAQFGFVPSSGVLANITDDNVLTGWAPSATDLAPYATPFFRSDGTFWRAPYACLEFNYGERVRLPTFLLTVESGSTLGDGVLIGSDFPATSTSDVVRDSIDEVIGVYTQAQLCSGQIQVTRALSENLAFQYYRLLQHATGQPITQPPTDIGGSPAKVQTYDSGSGTFATPDYTSTLTIELWGGAACGGDSVNATDGTDTTVSTYSLTAGAGQAATTGSANNATGAGVGGIATGGNTANVVGGDGAPPSPASTAQGVSGKGGDAHLGGAGGDPVANSGSVFLQGIDGHAPGGGGSGRNVQTSIAGGTYFKFPGGGAGGYVKHVLIKGVAGSPSAGDPIAYAVGVGALSPIGDGDGANGRVKFTWD